MVAAPIALKVAGAVLFRVRSVCTLIESHATATDAISVIVPGAGTVPPVITPDPLGAEDAARLGAELSGRLTEIPKAQYEDRQASN